MSVVQIPDEASDNFTAVEFNNDIFPNFDTDVIRNIKSINIHDEDIIICAYPKSGTHWIWEVTRLILAGHLNAKGIDKTVTMLERSPESGYMDLQSPRLLNTHVRVDQMPPGVLQKKVKVIYISRNPKDVAVSYYNFFQKVKVPYKGKWENFLRPYLLGKFPYGSWFDYINQWEDVKKSHPGLQIISLFYEDFKQNPFQEAGKLASFLGVERSEEFLKDVCQQCCFDIMKANAASKPGAMAYRKGEVGDWKNWFTVAQNEWFDHLYQEKMKDSPLKFKYTLV